MNVPIQLEMETMGFRGTKRSFETIWSESAVVVVDRLTFSEQQFFNPLDEKHCVKTLIHPELISYKDLQVFNGRKTRVTIEIIE